MNQRDLWILAALVAITPAIGDCGLPKLFRGQSPAAEPAPTVVTELPPPGAAQGPIIGTAPGYGEHAKHSHHHDFRPFSGYKDNNFGYEGGFYAGPEGYYSTHKNPRYMAGPQAHGGCEFCQGGHACPSGGCRHCGYGCKHGHPQHYHSYRYDWPQNMVYPQGPVPAGLVQYPYYTLKGPSDFFMK